MMNADIGPFLNQRFECPVCGGSGTWAAAARSMVREVSTIQGFRCRGCGEEVVVKIPRMAAGSSADTQLAQKEYRVLCQLQTAFPQDDQFGTLLPLGYLELDGCGAMVTRKFDGMNLVRHASGLGADGARRLFRSVGLLLRKLHDSCPGGYEPRSLGVRDKIAYLARTYGAELRRDPVMRSIYDQLAEEAERVNAFPLRATWSHGDFKPENVLCDGHKYVILDTQLEGSAAFVYDLASFLDHLLLAGQRVRGSGVRCQYQQAEEDLLAGYGGVSRQELAALRWTQLYFMLCYWGRYRSRGLVRGIYANRRIRPLAQRLAARLSSA